MHEGIGTRRWVGLDCVFKNLRSEPSAVEPAEARNRTYQARSDVHRHEFLLKFVSKATRQ